MKVVRSLRVARLAMGAAMILLPSGPPASAQSLDPDIPSQLVRLTRHTKAQIRLITYHQARTSFDGADIAGWYPIIRPTLRVPFSKWGEVDLAARYDVRHYEISGTSNLVTGQRTSGTPFNDLHNVNASLGTNLKLFDDVFLTTAGLVRARFETDANVERALRVGAYSGLGVQLERRLFVGAGIGGIRKAIDGEWRWVPIWQANAQVTERIELLVRNFNGRIRVKLDDEFSVAVIGRIARRSYRLKDRPGETASSIREEGIPVMFRVTQKPGSKLRIDYDFGIHFDQKYSTKVDGTRYEIDQGRMFFVGVGLRFRK